MADALGTLFDLVGPFLFPVVLFAGGLLGYGVLLALGRAGVIDGGPSHAGEGPSPGDGDGSSPGDGDGSSPGDGDGPSSDDGGPSRTGRDRSPDDSGSTTGEERGGGENRRDGSRRR